MKTNLTVFLFITSFPLYLLSQNSSCPFEKLMLERTPGINKEKLTAPDLADDIRALHIKSAQDRHDELLQNTNGALPNFEVFEANNTKASIKKTALDNNFMFVEVLGEIRDGDEWKKSYWYSHTYDGNDNLLEDHHKYWDGDILTDIWKTSSSYDADNNLIDVLYQNWYYYNWDDTPPAWRRYKNVYCYDDNNNRIESLNQRWDGANWVHAGKDSSSYDDNNNVIESLLTRMGWR